MPIDDKSVIAHVVKWDPAIFEVSRATYFKGYRKMRNGETHSITVEVLEDIARTGHPEFAYAASVKDEDTGKTAHGNGGPTPEEALSVLHWYDLDPLEQK
jgi:hypothetical protein